MFAPLSCSELYEMDSHKSKAEKFWEHIPILGWWIAGSIWYTRAQAIERKIEAQLTARPKPSPDIWGGNPRRVALGQYISTVAQEEIGWSCNHFSPDDSFEIVFWSHNDALDIDMALLDLQEHLGVKIEQTDVESWLGQPLGYVVDYLLAKQDSQRT